MRNVCNQTQNWANITWFQYKLTLNNRIETKHALVKPRFLLESFKPQRLHVIPTQKQNNPVSSQVCWCWWGATCRNWPWQTSCHDSQSPLPAGSASFVQLSPAGGQAWADTSTLSFP